MTGLKRYTRSVFIWAFIAATVGVVTGIAGALFHKAIEFATYTRQENDWLIFLLPVGGIIITALYGLSNERLSTNGVFDSVRAHKKISPILAPLIFVSGFITHLCGGSVGRGGAALQIGGSLAAQLGRAFRLKGEDMSTIIICGMSGAFSAIFTTPVTAAIFAFEVISVGRSRDYELLPSMVSSVTAYGVTVLMGNKVLSYEVAALPALDIVLFFKTALLALLVGLISIVFCVGIRKGVHYSKELIKNPYIRTVVGAGAIILLTLISGCRDYNGAGMDIIAKAVSGEVKYEAFILKLIFTVVTISAGFKGGEIMPAFFIGSTFGATLGMLLGIDMSAAAAMGVCAMFCGITNCPIASIALGAELFGTENFLCFAIVCAVSYVASGYFGLYKSQKIVYSKTDAQEINMFTK